MPYESEPLFVVYWPATGDSSAHPPGVCPASAAARMRWFRRPNQDSDAPRLISLSPLALEQQQQQTTTESSGWTFNRFAAPAAPLTDPADATHVPSAHLPCTLKRKPAVRRRSGGKGQHTLCSWPLQNQLLFQHFLVE